MIRPCFVAQLTTWSGVGRLRLVRSFPLVVPPGRNYVVDDAPRLIMDRYSYRGLADLDDDIILVEWDIAVSREDLAVFAGRARRSSREVLVADYPLYRTPGGGAPDDQVFSCHRRYTPDGWLRPCTPDDESCHLFGFGLSYLPRHVIAGFAQAWRDDLDAGTVRWEDTGFSGWVHNTLQPEVPIVREVRPVHLHYRVAEVPL